MPSGLLVRQPDLLRSGRSSYEIDDEAKTVTVTAVQHRADTYRPR